MTDTSTTKAIIKDMRKQAQEFRSVKEQEAADLLDNFANRLEAVGGGDDVRTSGAPTGFDAEFLAKRLTRVANLAGVTMPDGTYEQIAEVAGTILREIANKLEESAPPLNSVSDDDLWHIAGVVVELSGGSLFNVSQADCAARIRAAFMDPDAGREFLKRNAGGDIAKFDYNATIPPAARFNHRLGARAEHQIGAREAFIAGALTLPVSEAFLHICQEEVERIKLTSLPRKLEFAEKRGMTLEQVHDWMSNTRRAFEAAVADAGAGQSHGGTKTLPRFRQSYDHGDMRHD